MASTLTCFLGSIAKAKFLEGKLSTKFDEFSLNFEFFLTSFDFIKYSVLIHTYIYIYNIYICIYILIDSEYSTGNSTSKVSIGPIMKNQEIQRLVLDYLKQKRCANIQLKNCLLKEHLFLIDLRLNKCVIKLL